MLILKDNMFIPVDKRESVDDFEDYSGESSEDSDSSLFVGGKADADELEPIYSNGKKVSKDILYIAS